jgi:hypothetical protein
MKSEAARALDLTDRKSLWALQGVGLESEAESVRFHGRGMILQRGHGGTREHVSHPASVREVIEDTLDGGGIKGHMA